MQSTAISTPQQGEIIDEVSLLSALSKSNSPLLQWLKNLDSVLVLGGGVPTSPKEPPIYVQRRLDVVAELSHVLAEEGGELTSILCLSAGTAHLSQYILPNGLRKLMNLQPLIFARVDSDSLFEFVNNMFILVNHS